MSSGGALGSGHQLTADREFRYIVQWFSEWSDFQRDDFVPVVASYLATGTAKSPAPSPYVNGIIGGMASLSGQDKPMSLFQCRVKLFNEWSSKWPESHREKLLERLTELDADFGRQVQRELSGEAATAAQLPPGHPATNSDDPEEFGDPGSSLNDSYYQQQQQQISTSGTPSESHASPEPTTVVAPATIALVIAED